MCFLGTWWCEGCIASLSTKTKASARHFPGCTYAGRHLLGFHDLLGFAGLHGRPHLLCRPVRVGHRVLHLLHMLRSLPVQVLLSKGTRNFAIIMTSCVNHLRRQAPSSWTKACGCWWVSIPQKNLCKQFPQYAEVTKPINCNESQNLSIHVDPGYPWMPEQVPELYACELRPWPSSYSPMPWSSTRPVSTCQKKNSLACSCSSMFVSKLIIVHYQTRQYVEDLALN